MPLYFVIKTLHILSATVLFGTGMGIAFFMFRARFTPDISQKLYAARNTVLADTCFTLPAVVIQPVSGLWLVMHAGFRLTDFWLLSSIVLFMLARVGCPWCGYNCNCGLCWSRPRFPANLCQINSIVCLTSGSRWAGRRLSRWWEFSI